MRSSLDYGEDKTRSFSHW